MRFVPTRAAYAALLAATALGLLAGCGRSKAPEKTTVERTPPVHEKTSGPLIVFLGDSLTAGYNIDEQEAYPALIETKLRAAGYAVRVQNAGVSGDTAAGGARRLAWVLQQKPDIVVVALGANDGLRGLELAPMEAALREILKGIRASGSRALLVGMKIPPSMGADYAGRFERIYADLAREQGVPLVPFLLAGVAGRADMHFADAIHPRPEGHRLMAVNVLPYVQDLVAQLQRPPR
jgi:acyl-CoA thioesterase I